MGTDQRRWAYYGSIASLVIGGILLLGSWLFPESTMQSAVWTETQSKAYTEASKQVHQAAGERAKKPDDPQAEQRVIQAQDEMQRLKQQLDSARSATGRTRVTVRLIGLGLLIVGALVMRAMAAAADG